MEKIRLYTTLCILLVIALSCSEMNDIHEDFVDTKEKVYLTKPTEVESFAGKNRLKLEFNLINAYREKEVIGEYDGKSFSITLNSLMDDTTKVSYILEELNEGDYAIDLWSQDDNGKESLKTTIYGKAYGDKYRTTLSHRPIKEIVAYSDHVEVNWGVIEKSVGVIFSYTNNSEEEVTVSVSPDQEKLILEDFKVGGTYKYATMFLPEENAIDTFYTENVTGVFPTDYLLDKSHFSEYVLKNDNLGRSWGGSIDNLFDGDISAGNFYHTGEGGSSDGPPCTFTFDTGEMYRFTKLRFHARPGQINRLPKDFEIWTTDDITDADTDLSCTDPAWETEAIEKGWKQILVHVGDGSAPTNGEIDVVFPTDLEEMRYVRVKVKNIWDGSYFLNLSEISMWGQ